MALWQEKIAELNRFNQLGARERAWPFDFRQHGELLQVFDKIQKS
jgi:hypothetical protein